MEKKIQIGKRLGKNREWKAAADYRKWKKSLKKKKELWIYLKQKDFKTFMKIRYGILGQTMNIPGRSGRKISSLAYSVARRIIGFN